MAADLSRARAAAVLRPQPPTAPLGTTLKYNPQLWGDDELRAIFVARLGELQRLLDALRNTPAGKVPQHILITGQRGMGKTTLLRRLALAVRDDAELAAAWRVLDFPEEQYTVSKLSEFWRNVLDALADNLETQGATTAELAALDAAIGEIDALPPPEQEDAALDLLSDWLAEHRQRVVLLIDSSDLLFANLAGGGTARKEQRPIADASATPLWRLRKTLSHQPEIFWIGASYQALEAQNHYHDAFHDFFDLCELRPLGVDQMRQALLALARVFGIDGQRGEAGAAALAARLDARPERLKALRAMTGGNPRTTVLLFDLFAANGDGNVHSDLRGLLDMMTPLYKARMENLAEQPRKILAHLMELWAPQAARELAQAAGLPVTTVSGQLTRLESEALVDKVRLPGARRNGYQVSERLFNVWYLMRHAPRRMRQRLNWLVEFMRLWFSGEELLAQAQLRLARHAAGEVDEAALDYSRALASTLPEARAERRQLEWSVFSAVRQHATDTRRALHELFDLDGDDRAYATADDYLQRFGALDAGLAQCPHAADTLTEWIDAVKGSLSLSLAEKERVARESARLSGFQYCKLVQVFADERCTWSELFSPTAAATLRRATLAGDFFPDCPDSRLSYTQSMASFAEQPTAFVLAVSLLAVKFNDEWLDKAVRRAMTLDIPDARAWRELGNLLQDQLARYDEAEAAYRQAIDLDPDDPFATANLARLLAVRGERAAATLLFRQVLATGESPRWTTNGMRALRLQAELWLGNRDSARLLLADLAQPAANGDAYAFWRLREQLGECHRLGIAAELVALLEESALADFLRPLALALRAANGEDVLAAAPPEVAALAEEICATLVRPASRAQSA